MVAFLQRLRRNRLSNKLPNKGEHERLQPRRSQVQKKSLALDRKPYQLIAGRSKALWFQKQINRRPLTTVTEKSETGWVQELPSTEEEQRLWWGQVMKESSFQPATEYAKRFPDPPAPREEIQEEKSIGAAEYYKSLAELEANESTTAVYAYSRPSPANQSTLNLAEAGSLSHKDSNRGGSDDDAGDEDSLYKDPTPPSSPQHPPLGDVNNVTGLDDAVISTRKFEGTNSRGERRALITELVGPDGAPTVYVFRYEDGTKAYLVTDSRGSLVEAPAEDLLEKMNKLGLEDVPEAEERRYLPRPSLTKAHEDDLSLEKLSRAGRKLDGIRCVERPDEQTEAKAATWDVALEQILTSKYLHPAIKEAFQSDMEAGLRGQYHEDSGLVPNFSYPIVSAKWYDTMEQQQSHGTSLKGSSPLPDGISSCEAEEKSRPTTKDEQNRRHRLPSGLPTEAEAAEYRLLPTSELSTPESLETHMRRLDYTVAIQVKLIKNLHATIDELTPKLEGLEEAEIPVLMYMLEEKDKALRQQQEHMQKLEDDYVVLKIATDFANKVVAGCWNREHELWRWTIELSRRSKLMRRGWLSKFLGRQKSRTQVEGLEHWTLPGDYEENIFGPGPKPPSTRPKWSLYSETKMARGDGASQGHTGTGVLYRKEVASIIDVATQNLNVLEEDVREMVDLIKTCKAKVTGIEEIERGGRCDVEVRRDGTLVRDV